MTYITAPDVTKDKPVYRYLVEVISRETDWEGCPLHHEVLDVLATEPRKADLFALLAAKGWGEYTVVGIWQPEDGCDAF